MTIREISPKVATLGKIVKSSWLEKEQGVGKTCEKEGEKKRGEVEGVENPYAKNPSQEGGDKIQTP